MDFNKKYKPINKLKMGQGKKTRTKHNKTKKKPTKINDNMEYLSSDISIEKIAKLPLAELRKMINQIDKNEGSIGFLLPKHKLLKKLLNKQNQDLDIVRCAGCNEVYEDKKLLKCGGCRKVYYCSKECQKLHWKSHKELCSVISSNNNHNKEIHKKGSQVNKEQKEQKNYMKELEESWSIEEIKNDRLHLTHRDGLIFRIVGEDNDNYIVQVCSINWLKNYIFDKDSCVSAQRVFDNMVESLNKGFKIIIYKEHISMINSYNKFRNNDQSIR